MAYYKVCEKLPYTLSIQFSKSILAPLSEKFSTILPYNKMSNHISIKYLGYEENLTSLRLTEILSKLKDISSISKQDLEILRFDVFNNSHTFYENLLYLSVIPVEYLTAIHYKTIAILSESIDIFEMNDFDKYTPHISCGKITDKKILIDLNRMLEDHSKIYIKDWDIVLHTSNIEYRIL